MHSTRQKNCHNCIQAKRRCDRRTPTCSRCIEKNAPCTYGKIRGRAGPSGYLPSPTSLASSDGGISTTFHVPWLDSSMGMGPDLFGTESLTLEFDPASFGHGHPMETSADGPLAVFDPSIEESPSLRTSNPWTTDLSEGGGLPLPRAGSPVGDEILKSYDNMSKSCVSSAANHLP